MKAYFIGGQENQTTLDVLDDVQEIYFPVIKPRDNLETVRYVLVKVNRDTNTCTYVLDDLIKNNKRISLYLKDHNSLKYHGVWDYFRTRQTDNKLYMLVNRIYKDNILIGYEAEERESKQRR